MTLPVLSNYINGRFLEVEEANYIDNINPFTETAISRIPDSAESLVDLAVSAARSAQPSWSMLTTLERAAYLYRLADAIRKNVDSLAKTIVEEQGKLLDLARGEVSSAADYLEYTAQWARRIEGEIIDSDRRRERILLSWKPLGVVAGILPWNYPFFLIVRKLAPAIITGNTIVLKPSEETPNNCHEFCKLLSTVGLPEGVVNIVYGSGMRTGQALSGHPGIDMISFTGSVKTGSAIMSAAAKNITKVNLELGGKAPAIVLKDADLKLSVAAILKSRVTNSGQICNCAERVYVEESIIADFTAAMAHEMSELKLGNPLLHDVDMGPLINQAAISKVDALVQSAADSGAKIIYGGKRGDMKSGYFYEPTLITDCTSNMRIMHDEIFGPVLPVQGVTGLDEALVRANASDYGLTSSVYTTNVNAILKATRELNFGETYVNRENGEAIQGYHAGIGKSGIGGADGRHGLYEYMRSHITYLQET